MGRHAKIKVFVGIHLHRLTLVSFAEPQVLPNGDTHAMGNWKCDCGKIITTRISHVTNNASKSCGCLKRELASKRQTKHGMEGTQLCRIYRNIKNRCGNPNTPSYQDYGGRGIKVCKRWLGQNGLAAFIADMGQQPTPLHTVERRDVNGDYSPSNCYWLPLAEQNRNKRNSVRLTLDGVQLLQRDLAKLAGVDDSSIALRLKRGETPEQIRDYFNNRRAQIFREKYERMVAR